MSANDAFRAVSRYFDRISRPEQLLASLPAAFRVLTDPVETGAVTISLPEDVQAEAFDWPERFFEPRVWHVRRPAPEPGLIAEAVKLIGAAQAPLIVVGGGAIYSGASDDLAAFAARHGIPVVETQAGKGAIPWDHPMNAGPAGTNGGLAANRLAHDADLVLSIGSRLGDFVTASQTTFQNPDASFVNVNIAPMDAHKLRAVPIVADAREAVRALDAALSAAGYGGTAAAYRARVAGLKGEWDDIVTGLRSADGRGGDLGQAEIIGVVNDAVGGHATVICAAGSLPGDLLRLWRPEDPKAYHVEYGYSCMGYEIAAALGVRLADPDARRGRDGRRRVVPHAQLGDRDRRGGGAQADDRRRRQPRLPVHPRPPAVRRRPRLRQRAALPRSGRRPPDRPVRAGRLPAAHAEAMGATAILARTADELRAGLARARDTDGVTVVVVPAEPEKRMPTFETWWDVPVAAASERPAVHAARDAYESARRLQRTELN